jgi:hypothetical protein
MMHVMRAFDEHTCNPLLAARLEQERLMVMVGGACCIASGQLMRAATSAASFCQAVLAIETVPAAMSLTFLLSMASVAALLSMASVAAIASGVSTPASR